MADYFDNEKDEKGEGLSFTPKHKRATQQQVQPETEEIQDDKSESTSRTTTQQKTTQNRKSASQTAPKKETAEKVSLSASQNAQRDEVRAQIAQAANENWGSLRVKGTPEYMAMVWWEIQESNAKGNSELTLRDYEPEPEMKEMWLNKQMGKRKHNSPYKKGELLNDFIKPTKKGQKSGLKVHEAGPNKDKKNRPSTRFIDRLAKLEEKPLVKIGLTAGLAAVSGYAVMGYGALNTIRTFRKERKEFKEKNAERKKALMEFLSKNPKLTKRQAKKQHKEFRFSAKEAVRPWAKLAVRSSIYATALAGGAAIGPVPASIAIAGSYGAASLLKNSGALKWAKDKITGKKADKPELTAEEKKAKRKMRNRKLAEAGLQTAAMVAATFVGREIGDAVRDGSITDSISNFWENVKTSDTVQKLGEAKNTLADKAVDFKNDAGEFFDKAGDKASEIGGDLRDRLDYETTMAKGVLSGFADEMGFDELAQNIKPTQEELNNLYEKSGVKDVHDFIKGENNANVETTEKPNVSNQTIPEGDGKTVVENHNNTIVENDLPDENLDLTPTSENPALYQDVSALRFMREADPEQYRRFFGAYGPVEQQHDLYLEFAKEGLEAKGYTGDVLTEKVEKLVDSVENNNLAEYSEKIGYEPGTPIDQETFERVVADANQERASFTNTEKSDFLQYDKVTYNEQSARICTISGGAQNAEIDNLRIMRQQNPDLYKEICDTHNKDLLASMDRLQADAYVTRNPQVISELGLDPNDPKSYSEAINMYAEQMGPEWDQRSVDNRAAYYAGQEANQSLDKPIEGQEDFSIEQVDRSSWENNSEPVRETENENREERRGLFKRIFNREDKTDLSAADYQPQQQTATNAEKVAKLDEITGNNKATDPNLLAQMRNNQRNA